jgi:hypothetical protein
MKRNFTFNKFRICNGNIDNFLETKFNKTFDFQNENFFGKKRNKSKGNMRLVIIPQNDNYFFTTSNLHFSPQKKKIINKRMKVVFKKENEFDNLNKKNSNNLEKKTINFNQLNEQIFGNIIEKKSNYNFKNIKIIEDNKQDHKVKNSDSTISHLSVFQSINKGRSSMSIDFKYLLANNEEKNKTKQINQESFEKFRKNINDLLNLN